MVFAKVDRVDTGMGVQGLNVGHQGIEKVIPQTCGLAFVKMVARL